MKKLTVTLAAAIFATALTGCVVTPNQNGYGPGYTVDYTPAAVVGTAVGAALLVDALTPDHHHHHYAPPPPRPRPHWGHRWHRR